MISNAQIAPLSGKSLVIIGGTTGLGLSAVMSFRVAGANVVALGLKPDSPLPPLPENGPVRIILGDATEPRAAENAISKCLEAFGRFDGLYHVAGGSGRKWGDGLLHEVTDEAWLRTMELNLSSVFYSNRAAARQFLAQKSGGTILNLTSVLANSPSTRFFSTHAYATAKTAIIGLTKTCAASYAPKAIRFNALAPGLVDTPMAQRAVNDSRILEFVKTKQPLDGGRIGRPEDLDAAAVYFMSDASRFTTGQVLTVDGGWSLSEGQLPKDE